MKTRERVRTFRIGCGTVEVRFTAADRFVLVIECWGGEGKRRVTIDCSDDSAAQLIRELRKVPTKREEQAKQLRAQVNAASEA